MCILKNTKIYSKIILKLALLFKKMAKKVKL